MSEQEMVAVGSHQMMVDQSTTDVVGIIDQVSQRIERKALTDDRGSLQRPPVHRRQAVHASEHQTLYRPWNLLLTTFFGIVQQLLEEQRVALCAFDTVKSKLVVDVDKG